MLVSVQQHLAAQLPVADYAVLDLQALPFPEACFDAVIANHMLYHVPDRPRALAEVQRVLKPHVGRPFLCLDSWTAASA